MSKTKGEEQVKVIDHHLRYEVHNFNAGAWHLYGSYRFLWNAKRVARYRESLGVMPYRVVDTWR